jgi:hypothetical protein
MESIRQGNCHQSTIVLRCHRSSFFAFDKYAATFISFTIHALQSLLLLHFTDTFQLKKMQGKLKV